MNLDIILCDGEFAFRRALPVGCVSLWNLITWFELGQPLVRWLFYHQKPKGGWRQPLNDEFEIERVGPKLLDPVERGLSLNRPLLETSFSSPSFNFKTGRQTVPYVDTHGNRMYPFYAAFGNVTFISNQGIVYDISGCVV